MKLKYILLVISFSVLFFSCSEDNDINTPRNLQEYIDTLSSTDFGEVIACAANANGNTSLSYIFYYPETGATDIRYYEAEGLENDPNDFSKYRRNELAISDVFGGKLQRFSRSAETENWCLVTYMLNGKLHKSNPIRLKNATSPTVWDDEVTIEYSSLLEPKFTWSNLGTTNNAIYFQVISEKDNDEFISGTYTYDSYFQYFDDANVVNNINVPLIPADLEIDVEYVFTMMGVSTDNWVNLVIEESFVPRNLQEYLDASTVNTTEEITSFAASASGNNELSYTYFYPLTDARDFRYYETENITVDKDDFTNYKRKILTEEAVFGAKFRRFSRTDDTESWYIITYEIDEVVYKSAPIRLRNITQPTVYETEITIEYPESLKPKFTWQDYTTTNNNEYLFLITHSNLSFVSGVYTTQKTFTYNDFSNVTTNLNAGTTQDLVVEDQYKATLIGLSSDNWVNLVIQDSFEAQ